MDDLKFRGAVAICPGVGFRETDRRLFIDVGMVDGLLAEPCRSHRTAWVSLKVRVALCNAYHAKPDLDYREITILATDEQRGG